MAWIVLILSGVLEAVWASALSASKGFRRWKPTLLFFAAMLVSLGGLAWAMTELPTGTAYAVWVGVGATLAVVWAIVRREEKATLARLLLLLLLVVSIAGLKAVS